MADGGIKVLGIRQAVQNLKTMANVIQTRVTRKAVRAATRLIANAVRAQTYGAGRTKRTGLLQKSQSIAVSTRTQGVVTGKLIMRPIDVTGKSKVAQHVRRAKKAKLNNATEMAAAYWRFLEKGTKARATKGGANRGSVSPRPWVVPAFDATNAAALEAFSTVFNRETDDEARKLPKGVKR